MLEIFSCNSIESAKPIEGWREGERGGGGFYSS